MGAGTRQLGIPIQITTRDYSNIERMVIERAKDPTDYVVMRINPQRIAIRQRKVIQRVQTNTRWVFQHWGAEPVDISYSGVTGYMNVKIAQEYSQRYIPGQLNDFRYGVLSDKRLSPYNTPAYQALLKLRTFYEEPHKTLQGSDLTKISGRQTDAKLQQIRLNLYYRDNLYTGYFTRMEIREEETSPWMWNYSMEFTAFETTANTFSERLRLVERAELEKAAKAAGIAVDEHLAKGANIARSGIRLPQGLVYPDNARSRAAASATQGYKNESFQIDANLEANQIEKWRLTEESTDTD